MAKVKARTVLWYLTFIGFAVNYMIRINLNITIVEMVVFTNHHSANEESESLENNTTTETTTIASNLTSHEVLETSESHGKFHWNEYEQSLVLGSFFWAHWVTQIPGGVLAQKYGTKLVFGLSNAIGCWLCFFIPVASYNGYNVLIVLRILQGLITGLSWPAMHVLTAKWIPPNERSKFVSAYLGSSVGIAVFYPLFGYIMHWMTWQWVYYICGLIGTFWWISWQMFVFDTPALHPRISKEEQRYIETSLGTTLKVKENTLTPWWLILTSRPVWMNVVAQWGGIWGLFTLMTQAPTYFRIVHQWNIRAIGIFSGLPHVLRMLFALLFSMFADNLLHKNRMSRTNLRKLATFLCCIVKGILVLGLAYFGQEAVLAVIFLTLATMFHGAVSSGPLASIVDIAPNYAGIVLGISGMIGVLPGFISPYVVGILTTAYEPAEAWKDVFLIAAGMLIGSGILYILFSDSTQQKWNTYPLTDELETDSQALHKMIDPEKKVEQDQDSKAHNSV